MNTWIVIPAYNEARSLMEVLTACFDSCPDAQVVVVDDGSTDDTAQKAATTGAQVLVHALNRGQGAALMTGMQFALQQGADEIVHFDADGQFDAQDIPAALQTLHEKKVDVVLGSRFLLEESRALMPWSKRLMLASVGRVVNWLFTGVWLTDPQNGFRVFSRRAAEQIQITHDRMAHASEIIRQIKKQRLSFVEMPVTVYYHEYGQGVAGGIKIVKDLLVGKLL